MNLFLVHDENLVVEGDRVQHVVNSHVSDLELGGKRVGGDQLPRPILVGVVHALHEKLGILVAEH